MYVKATARINERESSYQKIFANVRTWPELELRLTKEGTTGKPVTSSDVTPAFHKRVEASIRAVWGVDPACPSLTLTPVLGTFIMKSDVNTEAHKILKRLKTELGVQDYAFSASPRKTRKTSRKMGSKRLETEEGLAVKKKLEARLKTLHKKKTELSEPATSS